MAPGGINYIHENNFLFYLRTLVTFLYSIVQIMISVKRVRREFGAMVDFVDRNAVENKDCYVECLPYEDKAYDLKKMELDIGSQVTSYPVLHSLNYAVSSL